MREQRGDLFFPPRGTHAICIPTNGNVRAHRAVMGAGIAKEAKERFPGVELVLGPLIETRGNHLHLLTKLDAYACVVLEGAFVPYHLVAFPTKSNWKRPASLDLIRRSAEELRALFPPEDADRLIVLPRVGCGLGGLAWDTVRPILQETLPGGRYVVLHEE